LDPLGEDIDLLPRTGRGAGRGKFRGHVRFEILVVAVELNNFKNVANPGHLNETTPCLRQHEYTEIARK